MTQFRKKPVVIEAKQATGTPESNREIIDWTRGSATPASMDDHPGRGKCLSISTLEGAHWVSPGDWIIKGVAGEFYPCKPDIFAATYEAATTALPVIDPGPDSLEREIQAKTDKAPRVTPADIEANIVHTEIVKHISPSGQVLRWAVLTTRNGFAVTGRPSASVSSSNDNAEIGEKVAVENAKQELWPLMGYELRSQLSNK